MKKFYFISFVILCSLTLFCGCKKDHYEEGKTEYCSYGGVDWKTHLKTDNGKIQFDFDITSNRLNNLTDGVLKLDSVFIDSVHTLPYKKSVSYCLSNNNEYDFVLSFTNDSVYYLINHFVINGYDEDVHIYGHNSTIVAYKVNVQVGNDK